jgi:peptidyl-tRNA hydrolase, PTH1 family
MRVVVGLGNPDTRYLRTRHNIGWMVIDRLCENLAVKLRGTFRHSFTAKATVENETLLLVKPTTYMNDSGLAVAEIADKFQFEISKDLIIVCDDVNLTLGSLRIRSKGSAGGHNGLKSVQHHIGTDEYTRMRLGVAGVYMGRMPLRDYVLRNFSAEEREDVGDLVDYATLAVTCWMNEGFDKAIARFNRRIVQDDDSD